MNTVVFSLVTSTWPPSSAVVWGEWLSKQQALGKWLHCASCTCLCLSTHIAKHPLAAEDGVLLSSSFFASFCAVFPKVSAQDNRIISQHNLELHIL